MAKVIKGDLAPNRWAVQYSWAEWLDGRQWELTHGTDFDTSLVNFRSMAYIAAKKLGKKVRVSLVGTDIVRLQAYTE